MKPANAINCLLLAGLFFFIAPSIHATAFAQDDAFSYRGKTLEQWIDVLDNDPDNEAKRRAAYAIGRIGPLASSAVQSLCIAMDSRSQELRHFAVDALGRIGPKAKDAVPAIVEGLGREQNSIHYYRSAARSLGLIGPAAKDAIPILVGALDIEGDALLQTEAALALWRIDRRPEALPKLIQVLRGDDVSAACRAAVAIGEVGGDSSDAMQALIAGLSHRSADVRRAAAASLESFGQPVIGPVVAHLQQQDLADPQPAIFLLGRIGSQIRESIFHNRRVSRERFVAAAEPAMRQALPALTGYLSDPRNAVRQAAVAAIAEYGLIGVPFALQKLGSPDAASRAAAADVLRRDEQVLPDSTALSNELQLVKKSLPARLVPFMKSQHKEVRAAAYRAFAEFALDGQDEAINGLLRDGLKDEDVTVRRFASKALKRATTHSE